MSNSNQVDIAKSSELVKQSMGLFNKNCQQFKSEEDLLTHATSMLALYVGLIEGIAGKEFADGFLNAAIEDLQRTVVTPVLVS